MKVKLKNSLLWSAGAFLGTIIAELLLGNSIDIFHALLCGVVMGIVSFTGSIISDKVGSKR